MFSLAFSEGEQAKINVDNIYPILRSLGLNPKNESVVDLVRESSIESKKENLICIMNLLLRLVEIEKNVILKCIYVIESIVISHPTMILFFGI